MKKIWIIVGAVVIVVVLSLFAFRLKNLSNQAKSDDSQISRPTGTFDEMLKSATNFEEHNELLLAQEVYKNIMMSYASHTGIEEVQKKLENLNMRIILSAINVPNATTSYEVKPGDSLTIIANQFGTTVALLKKENGLSSNVIRPGMRLRIWTGKFSLLVDKSQNILLLESDGDVVKTYRVSTGKNNITPVGTFKITSKLIDPAWTHEGKVIPTGDPKNILGTRWLGFDVPGYGVHGTTQPESIGQQMTAGCVRLLNNDVEELYDLLPLGTEITIMD